MEKCQYTKILENPLFQKGCLVEVRSNDPGFDGSWYEATVLHTPKDPRFRFNVQYKTLLSTRSSSSRKSKNENPLLQERISMSMIRPLSPCPRCKNAVFEVFQEVEVYHNDGWWPGVILKKMDETGDDGSFVYNVAFPLSREVFTFGAYDLRERMVWVADDQGFSWKYEDQLCNYNYDTEDELYKMTFHKGTRVEVSYDKETYGACWFVASILKIMGRTYCLVEYETLKAYNNDSSKPSLEEVVDMQYIRPCPPENMSRPISFNELDKVEAFYNSGWFLGIVSAVIPTCTTTSYAVKISEQNKEEIVSFGLTALRIPLVWEDGRWDENSQDKDYKAVHRRNGKKSKRSRESGNLTDDQSTKPLRKLRKLKNINGDKSPGHELSPSHDKDANFQVDNTVRSPEKRSKIKEDKFSTSNSAKKTILPEAENQKDFSTPNHKSSPSHDKDGNSLVRTTRRSSEKRLKSRGCKKEHSTSNSAEKSTVSEAKSPSLADKNLIFEDIPDHDNNPGGSSSAEIFKEIINDDIVEVDQDIENRKSTSDKGKEDVTTPAKLISFNFEAPISKDLVESANEFLRKFPQDPHFRPLHSYEKAAQEAMSYGLMLAFGNLVTSIKGLTIDMSDKVFEGKFDTMELLKEHGFNTEPLQATLEKLNEMRGKLTESMTKKCEMLPKVEELKEREERTHTEVSELREKTAGIEEEIRGKVSEMEKMRLEIAELESVTMRAEEESLAVKLKWGELLKLSW